MSMLQISVIESEICLQNEERTDRDSYRNKSYHCSMYSYILHKCMVQDLVKRLVREGVIRTPSTYAKTFDEGRF